MAARWQYLTVDFPIGLFGGVKDREGMERKLAELAESGWELASAFPISSGVYGITRKVFMIFKRLL